MGLSELRLELKRVIKRVDLLQNNPPSGGDARDAWHRKILVLNNKIFALQDRIEDVENGVSVAERREMNRKEREDWIISTRLAEAKVRSMTRATWSGRFNEMAMRRSGK